MAKQQVYQEVHKLETLCRESCKFLWENPETGGNEKQSADYMRNLLRLEGFTIVNEERLEHAFYAEYGSGHPVVAILGEYDALPALSQKVSAVKEAVAENAPGHGCGHNLLGSAAVTAAIAIKRIMEREGLGGTVRFYGCPEEELLSGKVKMAYYGMFEGCDLALSWHPNSGGMAVDQAYLSSAYARFYFTGVSAHAAFAPEAGRSALDAMELMSVGVNYLREHVISAARIHYATDSCGFPPNIVPNRAVAWYCIRAPRMSDVKDILARIQKVAEGAAMMTETTVETKIEHGCCEMYPNHAFADLTYETMLSVNPPIYTEEELRFAKEIQDTVNPAVVSKDKAAYGVDDVMCSRVGDRLTWKAAPMSASSDSGDVSYMMPMNLFCVPTWPLGVSPHTWQATACAGSSIGEKAALYAAKIIAGVAYDLFTRPEKTAAIIKEFKDGNVAYTPMYSE